MGRPRKFDEDQVLEAARGQFWEKGYAATSLDDLMRATGLGKGSLYGAFGDKHQLFLAVLDRYSAGRIEAMRSALCGDAPAIERLRGLFLADAREAGAAPSCRGCLLVNSTSELASHDAEVRKRAREAFGAVEDLLVEVVQQARDEGDLPPDTDPRELGRLLLAIVQGLEFLAKTGMEPSALGQIGRVAVAKLLDNPAAQGRATMARNQDVSSFQELGKLRRARVRFEGRDVGVLEELTKVGNGTRFRYNPEYDGPPIAPNMPLGQTYENTEVLLPFFANLLPEGALYEQTARRLGLKRNDRLGVLLGVGADTMGAIEILQLDPA